MLVLIGIVQKTWDLVGLRNWNGIHMLLVSTLQGLDFVIHNINCYGQATKRMDR